MDWSIGFIGAGVMAEVMIAGLLEEGVLPPFRIQASDPNASRREGLANQHGVTVWDDNVRV